MNQPIIMADKQARVTDLVVIGGGVIGCAIAYYARRAGLEVTLIERGQLGSQASGAAAGLLAPLGPLAGPGQYADLLLTGWRLLAELLPELEALSGIEIGYARTGALRIVREARREPRLRKRLRAWEGLGLETHWLTGAEAREREPGLTSEVVAAVYAPAEAQILAPRLVRAFSEAARRLGARLIEQTEVEGLETEGKSGRVVAVRYANSGRLVCGQLAIATGAWAARSGEWLGTPLPIVPVRGQLLALRQPAQPFLRLLIFGEAIYLAPKLDGRIIVGATREESGFEIEVTAGGISWLLATALRLVPALAACTLENCWAGLRPQTPDLRPVIGRLPGWENVVLALGHGSSGLMLSALTGQAISELLTAGQLPEVVQPFGQERIQASTI